MFGDVSISPSDIFSNSIEQGHRFWIWFKRYSFSLISIDTFWFKRENYPRVQESLSMSVDQSLDEQRNHHFPLQCADIWPDSPNWNHTVITMGFQLGLYTY